jgi:NitT/TauT family transport system permease protein
LNTKHQSFYQRHEGLLLGGSAVLVVVTFWEFIWIKQWVSPLFFSGPSAIAQQFWRLLKEETLVNDIVFSGKNFVLGLSTAVVAGVILGVLIGWYRKLRLIFDPFLNALYATPRIAMMPLIIIWFGIDWKSKVFIVFMSAFFPILVNTVGGVRSLDADLLRAARAFCASDWQIFKTVAIPGAVPFILTGIRQGVALGLIGVVVGEMFGGSQGVGFLVAYGGQTFQTDTVFVGVILIAAAGMLLTFFTERLERRFSRWRPER